MKVDEELSWLSEDGMVEDSEYWVGDGSEDMRNACLTFRVGIEIYKKHWNLFFFVVTTIMGYRYFDIFKDEYEGKLAESLFTMMKRDNSASRSWLQNFVNRGRFRLTSMEDDEKILCYVDEEEELISISFPAILALKGAYSEIQFTSLERNGATVSFF